MATRRNGFQALIPILSLMTGTAHVSAEFAPLNLPPFLREDLPNGLTLLAAEHREQPVLFLVGLIRAGAHQDPRGLEGLSAVVADLLQEGTEHYDSSALAQEIDRLGGHFSLHTDSEATWADLRVLAKGAEAGLDLFAEILRRPTFPARALRRVKQQHRALLRSGYANPDFAGMQHLCALLYGPELQPGRFPTDASLRRIHARDVEVFYRHHFHAANALVAAIGDADPRELLQALRQRFADWPTGRPDAPFQLPEQFQYPCRRRLVARKGLSQATLFLAGPGVPILSERFNPFQIADHLLGASGFSSRLMDAVRSQQGKTYGIHSSNAAARSFATFQIQTFTRNEQARDTLELIRAVVREAQQQGFTEQELHQAQTALIGGFPLQFESPSVWAHSAAWNLFLGRPYDYSLSARQRLARIELAQVNEALRQTVDADRLSLVIVGDPRKLRDLIEALQPLEIRKEKGDWY